MDGDSYSALADRKRFSTIDNQFNAMSSIIGDGRIDGWDIILDNFPNVILTKGSGFIDKHFVVTFNDQNFELSPNGVFYFYAQRRIGILGITGPRSNVATLTYSDSGPPKKPTGFLIFSSQNNPNFSANLSWNPNTEVDFDHYEIERTIEYPPINYSLVASISATFFVDTLDEDTTYYYRLYAIDQSGFRSSPNETSYTTKLSSKLPPNPIDVLMPSSEGAINVLWKYPINLPFSKIANWELSWIKLHSDGSEIPNTQQSKKINASTLFSRIENLINGEVYKIIIKTVDKKGRKSSGISKNIAPQFSNAPKDPKNITNTETELVKGFVVFNTTWTDGTDEYDPLVPYRYNIYITVDGQQESLPINVSIGELNEQIELYTFNGVNFLSIPQNTLVTLRLTSITQNGIESSGNYLRFITKNFGETLPLNNLSSRFNVDTGKITVQWNNQLDTDNIIIKVADNNLADDYPDGIIINKSIGLVNQFVFDADLRHIYTITVTPFSNSISGPSDTVVETASNINVPKPNPPSDIFVQAGDRQVLFTWTSSTNISVVAYNIYTKTGSISTVASDWELLDSVSKDITRFEDFGLENNQTYSYYITSVDLYGQESLHLPDNVLNLNFFEVIPKSSGIITEPDNVQLSWVNNNILISWNTLLEEFDSHTIYRSIGNLHSWQELAHVDRNTTKYLDKNIPLIDNTTYYYTIGKTVNDSDIVVQTSNISPENSIFLGKITVNNLSFSLPDTSGRREIQNLIDPINEFTNKFVLKHTHNDILKFDAERINLNPELIITDWETIDGRIFTTQELDILGTDYIVKVNGRFPFVLFEINTITRSIVFVEPIVEVNDVGNIIGTIPDIELKIIGIEEISGILPVDRFNKIHAKQIAFGKINKEQIPNINHDGRIREKMLPQTYLLERFSDHVFIVPQGNIDNTKTFGDGTTFFTVIENDGLIKEIIDWDLEKNDTIVAFQPPSFSITTVSNLEQSSSTGIAAVTDLVSFQSEKSYHISFKFIDNNSSRWVRVTTFNTLIKPNPIIDLKKRIKFRILLEDGSLYLTLGIREISKNSGITGDNGGINGPIEWVGITDTITDINNNTVPIGLLIEPKSTWQEIEFDLEKDTVFPFSDDADGILSGNVGVLEHLAFTINSDNISSNGVYNIYIDKLEQVDDVLVAGTSQGILLSRNFGTSWKSVRFTDTPVHKFYKGINNSFVWAVTASSVLISVDPANWFETTGLTGVQYIRDIVEDEFGNMFVSTDKGVYWFETALIQNFSSWRQTQPITAFTSDCYGMYHNFISSGIDEIWVSTEIGIYKTTDKGNTWVDTGLTTQGLPSFEFLNISTNPLIPNIIAITRKHVLRKLGTELKFTVLANFEVQHNVFDIWTMAFFANHLYISTGKGVFWNSLDELFVPNISATIFDRIFPGLDINGRTAFTFGLNTIQTSVDKNQLFIGQENRLMVSDENNILSIKEQFPNKELPSFFSETDEILSGYIYNAFNNVLCFREPQPINVLYRASNLPRKIYIPINKGWAQTNPLSDVFIFVNGIPKWLDFKLDEASILEELQTIQGKLTSIQGTLNTFNSLVPDAEKKLDIVLEDIVNIINGGQNNTSEITKKTITQFLDDYTRFLLLIIKSVVTDNELDILPKINLTGFPSSQRKKESRASLLEDKEQFIANDSTGINIDTFTGEIDFLTVFTQSTDLAAKQEFVFNKYDKLEITLFNVNTSNTGDFTHRELEDKMEAVNSGLSSYLAQSHYTNLIKAGIFFEGNHNFLFDRFNISNVQSKFHAAHTNDWYDIVNSTIDYKSILKVNSVPESRFANDFAIFTEEPYLVDRVWVATDNDILQYQLDTITGNLKIEKTIGPSDISSMFIWNIFVLHENDIYIVAEEKKTQIGHIFRTTDIGNTWDEIETINLPQQIYAFAILNGNKIAATESGIFYCDNNFGTWFPGSLTLSPQLNNNSSSVASFTKRIRNIELSRILITESDRWFYTSGEGINWFALGQQMLSNNVTVVNVIKRFKNLTWIGTNKGLYNDGNTVFSDNITFGLQTELESTSTMSSNINVSDIITGIDAFYCAADNKVYRFLNNTWSSYTLPNITSIHKIALRESTKDWLIIISHNSIQSIDVTSGSGVFN